MAYSNSWCNGKSKTMEHLVGLASLAQETGTVCGSCGDELGPEAVIWKLPLWVNQAERHLTVPVCAACAQSAFTYDGSIPEALEQGLRGYVMVRCAVCGREMHRLRDNRPPRRWEICSKRCRALAVTAKRNVRRHAEMQHVCAVCGAAFTGRRDARLCSPACRQKAFRARKRQ
jgi:hypothetical protein